MNVLQTNEKINKGDIITVENRQFNDIPFVVKDIISIGPFKSYYTLKVYPTISFQVFGEHIQSTFNRGYAEILLDTLEERGYLEFTFSASTELVKIIKKLELEILTDE